MVPLGKSSSYSSKEKWRYLICVDMRKANEAIKRERHITPTIDDIISKLNGAQVFTMLDMNNGFHQLVLTKDSTAAFQNFYR